MDEHPDFVFSCSSAQQLAWIKEYYPELFDRIRAKVRRRPVCAGGRHVGRIGHQHARRRGHGPAVPGGQELLPGASSAWTARRPGCRTRFGYSARPAADRRGRGQPLVPDPEDLLEPGQQDAAPHLPLGGHRRHPDLHPFPAGGHLQLRSGRPGAGARRAQLPRARPRHASPWCRSATATAAAAPPARWSPRRTARRTWRARPTVSIGTAAQFFAQAQAEYEAPPVWVGEMYLELHRGTYTSQANTKQGNRRSEHLLREAELWGATATVRTGPATRRRSSSGSGGWCCCSNSTTSCPAAPSPGSTRTPNGTTPPSSAGWRRSSRNAAAAALRGAAEPGVAASTPPRTRAPGVPALALPSRSAAGAGGGHAEGRRRLRAGQRHHPGRAGRQRPAGLAADHASGREAIAPGSVGNLLELHRDTPNDWDAWDIDEFYRTERRPRWHRRVGDAGT